MVSLISEALRKARQQAAGEGDQRRGVLYSWSPAARPRGTRLGLGLVLGAAIALGAALAGAGAVWWVVGHRQQPEVVGQGSSSEPETTAASSGDSSIAATQVTSPDPVTETPSQPAAADEKAVPTGGEDSTVGFSRDALAPNRSAGLRPSSTSRPGPSAPETTRPDATQETATTIGPNGERIYLVEADLGRVTLTLDFIVFRADDPFAEINGLDVHVGGTIEGFTVEAIERNQVVLRDQQGVLILRAP